MDLIPIIIGLVGGGFVCSGVTFAFLNGQKQKVSQSYDQQIAEMKEQLSRLQQEKQEAEAKVEAAGAPVAVAAAQAELAAQTKLAQEAVAKAQAAEQRTSEIIAQLQAAEARAQEAGERAQSADTRIQELEAQAGRFAQTNDQLKRQLTELETSHAQALEEARAAAQQSPEGAVAPLPAVELPAEVSELRSQLETVQASLAEVQAELEKVKDEREEAVLDRDMAVSERERLVDEREAWEQEQEARFQRIQEFAENQVSKLMTQNRELKSRLENLPLTGDSVGGSAERLAALASLAAFGIFEADAEGNWKFANPAWTKISGLSAEASLGNGWLSSIAEADRTGVESAWSVMVTNGSAFSRMFRLTTPDGQLRWVAIRAGQVHTGAEKSFVGLVEDITDRRRAEESSRSSIISLRSVVDASMEAIVFLDRRGDITSWNHSAERMFGYAQDEALGRSLMALLVPDDQAGLRRALARAAQSDQLHTPQLVEGLALCKNGTTLPVEINAAAWRAGEFGEEDADIRYTATIRDITERRRAEDMKRDKEAAEEANRAKSQFLANMSHELRTPLNAIIGFSEILHDRTFGDLTPKQERYVGNILSSGRHLLQLINDILDLSKVEAGHIKLEYVAFPVAVAIRNIEGLVKVLLHKKNLTLETVVPDQIPVLIADQAKFKQILYNLTSNAAKFTPDGGKITITANVIEEGKILQVAVSDTGIGIKQEDQERIFREFEQVDSSYARMQQGTGLGLALVKRFVEMHGGTIRVFSEGEGHGSTFIFTMPFTPPENEEGEGEGEAQASAPDGSRPIVLVVDDDQSASELLTHHLQMAGYTVSRAFSGADALLLAREMRPSIITLDVQLPDREGWSVLEALKQDAATRDIPVLMVSIIEDRERAEALGAADCFVKPIAKDRLLGKIAELTGAGTGATASEEAQAQDSEEETTTIIVPAMTQSAPAEEEEEHVTMILDGNKEAASSSRSKRGGRSRAAG